MQPADGIWLNQWPQGNPYPLIGAGALFSLVKAGAILKDPRCPQAVARYLAAMNARGECVNGTHAYLAPLHAHAADAV